MYQPPINNLPQGPSKKSTVRNKQLDHVNNVNNAIDKTKKTVVPIQTLVSNKPTSRKPFRNNSKQVLTGPREKAFSKNERKTESRNYKQSSARGREQFAIQDLLNFQYSSGRNVDTNNSGYRSTYTRRNKAFFNKEEYLQAKCQFVVVGTPDEYSINAVDPDKLVDWDKVHLVYIPSHDPPNCPVCLYPPTAAKITKCGHIFCWSCMLHYLHLEEDDKSWRKCPICHEAVHQKDLKSVKSYAQTKYARLDSISMKLMKRSKDSIFVLPNCEGALPRLEFSYWLGNTFDTSSKIMLATPEQVVKELLMKERDELRIQLENDMAEENGEATFISMALEILEEEIKSFNLKEGVSQLSFCSDGGGDEDLDASTTDGTITLSSLLGDTSLNENYIAEAAFSDDEVSDMLESVAGEIECNSHHGRLSETSTVSNDPSFREDQDNDLAQSPTSEYSFISEGKSKNDSYYFYQAEDGQNIFLHSLNARCLIEEYGSLDYGPLKVKGQIIDFDCYTMTKELRKRFRYLSHLPLSSEFMICELILNPPLLSKRTIHNFMPEFKNRKALRLKKFKEQQKFDRQATAIENKKHGFHVDTEYYEDDDIGIDLSNAEDFPSNLSPESLERETKGCFPEHDGDDPHTPSFAQMLNKKVDVNKRVEKEGRYSITKTVQHYKSFPTPLRNNMNSEDEEEPEIVAPDFKATFSAAMFAAPIKNENPGGGKGKNKRKKEKGMLLFATGGQRKY